MQVKFIKSHLICYINLNFTYINFVINVLLRN